MHGRFIVTGTAWYWPNCTLHNRWFPHKLCHFYHSSEL